MLLPAIFPQKSLPQASSNEPPKFRVRYFDVEGYAIDFLMKGMVDEKMEKDLAGQPFIVPNEIFKEINFIMDNFMRSSNAEYLTGENKKRFEINKNTFSSLVSDILDYDVMANKEILSDVKNDSSWNLRWRECGDKEKIITDIKQGNISAFCFSLWKFAKNSDLNIFKDNNLSFYKYITKNNHPADFSIIDIGYPTCTYEWGVGLISRNAAIRVAIIENISNSTIKIGEFFARKNNALRLMERNANIDILNRKNIERINMFPMSYLRTGEKILIPLEVYFKYDKEKKKFIKKFYNDNEQAVDLINSSKINKFSINEDTDGQMGEMSHESLIKFVNKKKKNIAIEKEFTYGPSLSIEKIEVDGKLYQFRKYDEKTFVLYGGRETGSCPYAYTYSAEIKQWLSEGHILYGKSSKRKEGWDSIKLKRFTGKVIIKENDPEVSLIDLLRIRVKNSDGKEQVLLPKQAVLRSEDQQYLTMKQGDQTEVEFDGFQENAGSTFYLESKGYYEVK